LVVHRAVMVGRSVPESRRVVSCIPRRSDSPARHPKNARTCCRNPAALISISSHGVVVGKIDAAGSPGPGSAITVAVGHPEGTFCPASGAGHGARRRTAPAQRTTWAGAPL